jgi:cytochrome c biogenesis protein CcmG/thiol:disulfide interchange protein DsbE
MRKAMFGSKRKTTISKTGILIGLLAAAVILPAAGCSSSSESSAPSMVSDVGRSVEDLKGKVVLLDIWATWCPPCRKGIPDLIELQKSYGDKGLEVVGVSVDPITQGGDLKLVTSFAESTKINYKIWLVGNQAALSKFPIATGSIPTSYLVDREGKVVKRYDGLQQKSVYENDIKKLL